GESEVVDPSQRARLLPEQGALPVVDRHTTGAPGRDDQIPVGRYGCGALVRGELEPLLGPGRPLGWPPAAPGRRGPHRVEPNGVAEAGQQGGADRVRTRVPRREGNRLAEVGPHAPAVSRRPGHPDRLRPPGENLPEIFGDLSLRALLLARELAPLLRQFP